MNIILDTNAFTFFYKTYCEIDVPNKWNERKFDNQEYLRCLANCDKILITSETLYELFLQSLRKDGTLKLFLEQYVLMNEINKGRFTLFKELGNGEKGKLVIFNDKNTMYFDSVYLAECVNYRKTLDISRFLSVKIEGEIKYIKRFMDTLLGSVVNVLHEINGDKVIVERYKKVLDKCYAYEETILRKLYDECYIKRKIDNKQFENELDKMLKDVFQLVYEEINGQAFLLDSDKVFFDELRSNEVFGVNYISKVFNKISTSSKIKCKDIYLKELESFIDVFKNKLEKEYGKAVYSSEMAFIKYILEKYIIDKRSIKKNDIIDCLIISALDEKIEIIVNDNIRFKDNCIPSSQNTCLITFDTTLYNFSKKHKWMYNQEIYNTFLK